jgi:phosphate:Na+ symporter
MLAVEVFAIEDKIDQLATQGNEGHVLRLCEGICNHPSGYYFLKMMERLEKISDHCENIAELVIRREDI